MNYDQPLSISSEFLFFVVSSASRFFASVFCPFFFFPEPIIVWVVLKKSISFSNDACTSGSFMARASFVVVLLGCVVQRRRLTRWVKWREQVEEGHIR